MSLEVARRCLRLAQRGLLQAVAPQALQHLSTVEVLRFGATSGLVWRATSARGQRLMPCLDRCPEEKEPLQRFLSSLAPGSVRILCLDAVGFHELLDGGPRLAFSGLERLVLPQGLGTRLECLPVPRVPQLRELAVHAGAGELEVSGSSTYPQWLQ
ncbi:unnamed protein product, partial [Effrenium voratum]